MLDPDNEITVKVRYEKCKCCKGTGQEMTLPEEGFLYLLCHVCKGFGQTLTHL